MTFWFGLPTHRALLALLRIGTALVLLYVLFVRSFDLDAEFSRVVWADPALGRSLDGIAWPFSVFTWFGSPGWLWSMHVLALVAATAFLVGLLTPLTAALSLVFQLSYAHQNPVMLLGLDGLLMLALFYLSLVPSGRVLGVFGKVEPERPRFPPYLAYLEDELPRPEPGLRWSGLVLRVLQLHLCLLYFLSALGKLSTDWLAGIALWHPRLVELGAPYAVASLLAHPYLTSLVTYPLVLFELFYGVLIWIPSLRYVMLALALVVHLTVGFAWGLLPFNLMMIVLNLAFVPPSHLESLLRAVRPLLLPPWLATGRGE
jgi:hypothetical protein